MNQKIYLNPKKSEYFELPYENDGEKTVIHSSALRSPDFLAKFGDWDSAHNEILETGRDLQLLGVGKGWWSIQNSAPMVSERIKRLGQSVDEKTLVAKTGKKSTDKTKLSEEFKKFSKINKRVEERLDEGGAYGAQGGTESARIGSNPQSYGTGFNPKAGLSNYPGYGKTVNTFIPTIDNSGNMKNAAYLQPKEALNLSIKRTIESGAPIKDLDFYAEVNWHLNNMGFSAQKPIDIKELLKKMLKEK